VFNVSTDEAIELIQVVTGFCALDTELSAKKSSFVHDLSYDTTEEFNVDLKAEYLALSSTHSQKKTKNKQRQSCSTNSVTNGLLVLKF